MTPRVCTRTSNRLNNQGLNYDTAKKQFDQRGVTHHALGSNGLANVHLPFKKAADPVYNTHAHPAEFQEECAAHYVKSEEAADTSDAALPHSLEGGWNLVQGKKGVVQDTRRRIVHL